MRPDGVLIIAGVPRTTAFAGLTILVFLPRVVGTLRFVVWPCAIGPVIVPNKRAIMRIVAGFKVNLLMTIKNYVSLYLLVVRKPLHCINISLLSKQRVERR